jgi:hypothetical protein
MLNWIVEMMAVLPVALTPIKSSLPLLADNDRSELHHITKSHHRHGEDVRPRNYINPPAQISKFAARSLNQAPETCMSRSPGGYGNGSCPWGSDKKSKPNHGNQFIQTSSVLNPRSFVDSSCVQPCSGRSARSHCAPDNVFG